MRLRANLVLYFIIKRLGTRTTNRGLWKVYLGTRMVIHHFINYATNLSLDGAHVFDHESRALIYESDRCTQSKKVFIRNVTMEKCIIKDEQLKLSLIGMPVFRCY